MNLMRKRYYILIFFLALISGIVLRSIENDSFQIVKNSTVYAPENQTATVDAGTEKKININTADIYELNELCGIGDGIGNRIISYREENGEFEVIEDIMKVKGIGEKKFEEIKNYICVE